MEAFERESTGRLIRPVLKQRSAIFSWYRSNLPRGTRIRVGTTGKLKEILYGPAKVDDGSQNLVGALKTSMGSLGAANIKEMHDVEIIIAPSIQTEGKVFQVGQRVGMGK